MSTPIIEFNSDSETQQKFKLSISGTKELPIARLLIPINEELDICLSIPGSIKNNAVEVTIPKVGSFFENKKEIDNIRLEVLVENTVFTPWKGKAIIKHNVKVIAESEVIQETQTTTKPSINIETISVESHDTNDLVISKFDNILKDMFK